ncbi:MAG: hypothetical protein M9883_13415 [Methylobacteriaceae bacterium]|nr:hypothetical protein [Methylobacteriaceae bacterium]MCC2101302.1 hypothetical protein [Hyphomicrobiales bacterium]MCO5087844.1 hypothetical protein [Methylobacteriaceae bacterium]
MVRPFRLALLAGATALGAVTLSAPPAAAQFLSPWNVWSDPRVVGPDDDFVEDNFLPPQAIRRIVAAQGYRLAAAPRLAGDNVIAIGRNARGERVRFVIDGYSGELLRRTALGGGQRLAPDQLEPGAPHRKAKARPKHKPNSQTVARKPAIETAPKVETPAPSQATKAPASPAPTVDAPRIEPARTEPAKADAVKPAEPPKAAVVTAPTPADKTPLAPDAAVQPRPAAAATPAPQQASVPTTPAPAEKPPLTAEPKAQAETPAAKPSDIGPRVEPVARAPETTSADAKPADTAAKPVEPPAK